MPKSRRSLSRRHKSGKQFTLQRVVYTREVVVPEARNKAGELIRPEFIKTIKKEGSIRHGGFKQMK